MALNLCPRADSKEQQIKWLIVYSCPERKQGSHNRETTVHTDEDYGSMSCYRGTFWTFF